MQVGSAFIYSIFDKPPLGYYFGSQQSKGFCMLLHFRKASKRRNNTKNENLLSIFTKEINKMTQILTSESHIATQMLSLG